MHNNIRYIILLIATVLAISSAPIYANDGTGSAMADTTNVADANTVGLAAGFIEAATDSATMVKSPVAIATDSIGIMSDTTLLAATLDLNPALPPLDPTHRVRTAEWVVPGAVFVLSALSVHSSWGKHLRERLQHKASAYGKYKMRVDDYAQYSPMVAVYGLDLIGVKAQHSFIDRTILLAMSAATMAAVVNIGKYTFKEPRPDSSANNSFPSGHTATSFMGAEFLWQEYRSTHPWIGITGYALAFGVGYLRIHNHRHWANDVLAGAAVGMLSTKFAYWLYPKLFREHPRKQHRKGRKGNSAKAFGMPFVGNGSAGVNMAMVF